MELGVLSRATSLGAFNFVRSGNFLYVQPLGVTMEMKPLLGFPLYPAPSQAEMYILPDASTSMSVTCEQAMKSSGLLVNDAPFFSTRWM